MWLSNQTDIIIAYKKKLILLSFQMILAPIMALTEQYFALRLALLDGMPINLNPLTNLQRTLSSEPTINKIILQS